MTTETEQRTASRRFRIPWRVPPALRTVSAMCVREIVTFVRDRSRLSGALLQPLGFWLLIGLGFQGTFQMPAQTGVDIGYMEFLFPGIIAIILLFTAIFSTISIVEERKSGFLQAALVAPTPRAALVFGNTLGGSLLATAQALLFLLLLPVIGLGFTLTGITMALLICFLAGLAFTALGFTIAWRMTSTRGFHAVMMLFLLPLWFLSSGPFPAEGASPALQWIMAANPVTYVVSGLRHALYWPGPAPVAMAGPGICLLVTVLFTAAMIALATRIVRRPLYRADESN